MKYFIFRNIGNQFYALKISKYFHIKMYATKFTHTENTIFSFKMQCGSETARGSKEKKECNSYELWRRAGAPGFIVVKYIFL